MSPRKTPSTRRHAGRRGWRSVAQPLTVTVCLVVLLGVPLWLVVATAMKSQAEALRPDLSLPQTFHLFENVKEVWTRGEVGAGFAGSCLVMIPSVLIVLIFGSLAAWIFARRTSRVLSVAYAAAISGIILPPAVVTIVLLLRQLGLAGSAIGMVAVYCGIYMSTVIFFVTGFVRALPISLEEAARIDGAGPIRVFTTIILPLLRPVLATATILICLYVWNDVYYALFVIGGRIDTLPLNLYKVASQGLYLNNWHLIFTYVVLMTLPFLIIFTIFQRHIISGVTSGAVK